MKSYILGKNEENVRLSRFVESVTSNMPSSIMYKSFRNKRVKVNGKAEKPDTRVHEGELVELYINDEFFKNEIPLQPKTKRFPLKIIYEDTNIAVIYKPAHLLCHSDGTQDANLVDAFTQYLSDKGEYSAVNETTFTPAICNRLDRGTEGLVIGAKSYTALRDMNEIIRKDLLVKTYLCICCGIPPKGVFTAYLHHFEDNNKVQLVKEPRDGYKKIITEVDVINTKAPLSLCKIGLITGRTHQIRAHLAFLGAPVLGDIKYGSTKMNKKYATKTQYLCAYNLLLKEIPADNTLAYLSNKKIELQEPEILKKFNSL